MKSKLMTTCFATVMSMFNTNAMNIDYAEQLDYEADSAAIANVRSLADFANLPDLRVKRLNSNFVAEARAAHKKVSTFSKVQTLADFSALDTNWLQPELVKAIKRADIKENFNLPTSLYENIEGIPANNTIGTQLMTIMNGGNCQPTANDAVSRAFEILYKTIVINAHITTDIIIPVDADGDYCFFQNMIFLSNFINRTTGIYLKFLSGVLVSGRKAENDFSNIQSEVMPEFLDMIRAMINHATDEELGI